VGGSRKLRRDGGDDIAVESGSEPQGLKPASLKGSCGTTEVVPFPFVLLSPFIAHPAYVTNVHLLSAERARSGKLYGIARFPPKVIPISCHTL
jgi:hypothetical protein